VVAKGRVAISFDFPDAEACPTDGAVDLVRDRQLVERCQGGDRAAFEELYNRYYRRLFHFCLRRLHESHEAEDAVQESFARAWRALPSFAGERRFYPWLTVIAGNVCTDTLRRRARLTPVDEVPMSHEDRFAHDADEALIQQVDAAMAVAALGNLSTRHQRVLQLREGSGWSTQQLAEHEGVGIPAMETLLWRARQALKREFAALADAGGRFGVGIGLAGAAARRLMGRGASRVAQSLPVLQAARGSGTLIPSLILVSGAVVGTAVLVTGTAGPFASTTAPAVSHHGAALPTAPALPAVSAPALGAHPAFAQSSATPFRLGTAKTTTLGANPITPGLAASPTHATLGLPVAPPSQKPMGSLSPGPSLGLGPAVGNVLNSAGLGPLGTGIGVSLGNLVAGISTALGDLTSGVTKTLAGATGLVTPSGSGSPSLPGVVGSTVDGLGHSLSGAGHGLTNTLGNLVTGLTNTLLHLTPPPPPPSTTTKSPSSTAPSSTSAPPSSDTGTKSTNAPAPTPSTAANSANSSTDAPSP
jgi:RNA polymerase sigma-70 factor (ECF subfamily)